MAPGILVLPLRDMFLRLVLRRSKGSWMGETEQVMRVLLRLRDLCHGVLGSACLLYQSGTIRARTHTVRKSLPLQDQMHAANASGVGAAHAGARGKRHDDRRKGGRHRCAHMLVGREVLTCPHGSAVAMRCAVLTTATLLAGAHHAACAGRGFCSLTLSLSDSTSLPPDSEHYLQWRRRISPSAYTLSGTDIRNASMTDCALSAYSISVSQARGRQDLCTARQSLRVSPYAPATPCPLLTMHSLRHLRYRLCTHCGMSSTDLA
eukprot:2270438-Rhodomonas_salina.3